MSLGVLSTAFAAARTPVGWIAHRGASWIAPEETRLAYEQAIQTGNARYLELDVQRTRDGELILFHDEGPARTTDYLAQHPGSTVETQPKIGELTWAELQALDAGSWFNAAYPDRAKPEHVGQKVLSLREFVQLVKSSRTSAQIYLEFKNPELYPGIEAEAVELLRSEGALDRVLFQSFDLKSLIRVKRLAPSRPTAWLVSELDESGWKGLEQTALQAGVSVLAPRGDLFGASTVELPKAMLRWYKAIRSAHRAGLQVHVWVLNEKLHARLFSWLGADALHTDRIDVAPSWL